MTQTTTTSRPTEFPDGRAYRIEIPSCEGPRVMEAILKSADKREVRVDRVSQGSGVTMLTDAEIREMVALGNDQGTDVFLFLGPRAAWGPGAHARSNAAVGAAAIGAQGVRDCVDEAQRAAGLGVAGLLVGDVGVLQTLGEMKRSGDLPDTLGLKTSVMLPLTNPATGALYESLGATSLNLGTDLSLDQIEEISRVVTVPLDMYVEAPDDQGGSVRIHEAAELARRCAPIYLKLGVRNAPNIYPTGEHLIDVAMALGQERVRRAQLVVEMMARQSQ